MTGCTCLFYQSFFTAVLYSNVIKLIKPCQSSPAINQSYVGITREICQLPEGFISGYFVNEKFLGTTNRQIAYLPQIMVYC